MKTPKTPKEIRKMVLLCVGVAIVFAIIYFAVTGDPQVIPPRD